MKTAQAIYDSLQTERNYWLDRARRSASLTIPYLIPRSNTPTMDNTDSFVLPWNGIGQRGCNNLAAKLLMAILPPTEAFFRFTLDPVELEKQEAQMEEAGATPEDIASAKSEIELALNKLELSLLRSIETSNDRVMVHEALMHLIVGGNCLMHIADDGLLVYPMNRYVLLRDPIGEPLCAVVKETVALDQLPAGVRDQLAEDDEYKDLLDNTDPMPTGQPEKTVDIYTIVKWNAESVKWHQEINKKEIVGTSGLSPKSTSPWLRNVGRHTSRSLSRSTFRLRRCSPNHLFRSFGIRLKVRSDCTGAVHVHFFQFIAVRFKMRFDRTGAAQTHF